MSTPLLQSHPFKIHDKVCVLKKDDKEIWRTVWHGIILKLGTTDALIWDSRSSDSNTGKIEESSTWIPYDSKMLKIKKGQ